MVDLDILPFMPATVTSPRPEVMTETLAAHKYPCRRSRPCRPRPGYWRSARIILSADASSWDRSWCYSVRVLLVFRRGLSCATETLIFLSSDTLTVTVPRSSLTRMVLPAGRSCSVRRCSRRSSRQKSRRFPSSSPIWMCSPMFFQSKRDAWVAISPADQEQHQENAAHANAARRLAVALGLLVFDQLEHAPQDQQRGPEAGKQRSEVVDIHDPHRPQQEQDSHQDQHDGPGNRTMWRPRSRRCGIIGLATVHLLTGGWYGRCSEEPAAQEESGFPTDSRPGVIDARRVPPSMRSPAAT
jgi:hypothetical protein